jgi:hypothetical protein
MNTGSLATTDWGAVALFVVVAGAMLWGIVFFLRQNRSDLDSLQETLRSERDEDDADEQPR